jgi:hypothetical protein
MKRVTSTITACALAVLAVLASQVQGQESNTSERTFMTFSSPVELPGVTLDAGTYEFRLADTPTRNVVQVFRKDGRDVVGQWTFAQASRPRVSSETVVMFREAKEGGTPAIQFWYFPNEKIGKEFIYPKDQAARIAARTGESVLTEEGRVNPSAPDVAAIRPVEPEPRDEARAEAPAQEAREEPPSRQARAEAPAPAPQAQPAPAPAPRPVGTSGVESQAPAQRAQGDELPRTASPLALTGLIGLLSLAGAFGVRALRR